MDQRSTDTLDAIVRILERDEMLTDDARAALIDLIDSAYGQLIKRDLTTEADES